MRKFFQAGLAAFLTLAVVAGAWAETVKTDGKNKDSPIQVTKLDFYDSGYGQPGPNAEIRISTTVKNASAEDTLKNVVIHLQLKNLAGDVVQEWVHKAGEMKPGASVSYQPDSIYYNNSFNNVQPGVLVEHDKVEEKKKEAAPEATPTPDASETPAKKTSKKSSKKKK
ncbi:MAG: hypothetical protein KC910_24910 [Candidatus Eremiobacteraeota bacterium]|nr:hypothetical protein [Candidatus Eremiobacteraeota bacterium]